ncbi:MULTISPECIES: glycosyltransferase family 4 protein [Thalassospira]|uniref:Glycosyl transferase n=2 Tax=Thalassospira TaxID=168934 RepID=A0A367WBM2_9PROT|nr:MULTISPECIES: glycosyltransferase family 4 protein [Thalassospira]MDG4718169.1 glycosyltransferase family 4 protein [Thalassospira sp. FZY0004]RCK37932.1 glycosyl transferase [Thalassospira profundimaris]
MELINPIPLKSETGPSVWMVSRVDQAAILAAHLANQNRLVRWDSFWRHDGHGYFSPPSRKTDPMLTPIPGRHLLPDLLGQAAKKLRLPAGNLYSDIPLSLLASLRIPKADIFHGQGNYSLPAMRRAKARGMITIADITGQLAPTRYQQLAAEYHAHGRSYHEISEFLARRRMSEARFADAVLAPSETVACGLQDCGISERNIFLVPFLSPLCGSLLNRPRPPRHETVIRILYVGNLSLAKGIAHLLAAWDMVRRQYRLRASLTLVGRAQPCAKALLENLPDGCEWLGALPQNEVADRMLSADIFVFPSLSEGSSLAVMEAMAAGCAIVTTFDAGSPVINHLNGFIIPPRDAGAITTALSVLIENPAMRKSLSQSARDQINHDLQTGYGNRVDAAYETVLSRHG